ncbi:DUF3800 domain-containing protein [Rathayibacter iranicus]|uniref:DUF3800 domain-containing protein n=1 Tax=Rathayibacter iranicus TaxID=59737 RepID=A0AAD1AIW3_9MICO|nr:DUF3800 domain-containing protein [Rathayibacter iranicus]AZZ57296.1 DUF3800 domain-containing protein [Rathayibacter iranicus]MWV32256.1 DUF3800 domain-containing protein [Rathayibacter iranicus NCPPB 2253 = VKM Ac-1602]PPI62412.1 DUF3800 domain-containing protein [Rathayibacter iranicus]
MTAYLDESYTDERYYVAAFIIDDADLPALNAARARMSTFIEGFGVDSDTELHAHSLMTGRDGFEPIARQVRARIRIYQQWMTELAALPAHVVVRGVDISRLNARYKYPDPPHQVALQHTLEATDRCARQHGKQVRIVADVVPGQVAHAENMVRYQHVGTPGYRSSKLTAVVPPLVFEDSARFPGLQAADAIAYIYRRLDAHVETDNRVGSAVDRLWSTLRDLVYEVWRWDP